MTAPLPATRTAFSVDAVVDAIAGVTHGKAPLHAPEIAGNEWQYVKECLDTEWVSAVGSYVNRFEEMLASYTGAKHAIATNNGTSALHACLMVAGVARDDEVVIPSLTFIATANAVAYCGAHPHFADIAPDTMGLDPARLAAHLGAVAERRDGAVYNRATGRRISAVVCMHSFGHPADLDGLLAVTGDWRLPLVEDAAESLGSFYKGRHTGTFGLISSLSFNGNKIVTTGGGGAILTNDPGLAARAKHLTTTAKKPHAWAFEHDMIGYNYRLPNINAAMGCAQMERLDDFLTRKRIIAGRYAEAFAHIDGVRYVDAPADCVSNYWLNCIVLDDAEARDQVLAATNDAGLMTRPAWTPMHFLPMFTDCPRDDLRVTEHVFRHLINVPSSPRLANVSPESASH